MRAVWSNAISRTCKTQIWFRHMSSCGLCRGIGIGLCKAEIAEGRFAILNGEQRTSATHRVAAYSAAGYHMLVKGRCCICAFADEFIVYKCEVFRKVCMAWLQAILHIGECHDVAAGYQRIDKG